MIELPDLEKAWLPAYTLLFVMILILCVSLSIFFTRKNIDKEYRQQIKTITEQRDQLFKVAQNLEDKLTYYLDSISIEKEKRDSIIKERYEDLDSINNVSDDDIIKFLSDRYNIQPRTDNNN